jgi:thiol-disulfide isomerase/thioredoxin
MKSIQQLFGLVILITILGSCSTDNGFIIKGHIEGIKDSSLITLYDFDPQITLDSAYSINGNFELKGKVDNPTGCWLKCNDEYAILQVENTEMIFNSPLKDMRLKSTITGGKEQEMQNELNNLQFPYDNIYLGALDSLMNKKYSNDTDKQRLIKVYNESQSISQEIYINFGKRHPQTYLGLNIIYMNRKSIPRDTVKIIYEKLSSSFKETPNAKALKIFLYEHLAQKGQPFIDFNAKTLNGEDFSLSSLKGKYIYLSFWSAGCGPCRMENRFLSRSFKEIPKDLLLVSFSIDKNIKLWNEASKADSIQWYNVSSLAGEFGRVKTIYEVQAIPTSFLIDRNGVIIEKFTGFDTNETLIKQLKTLIDQK